MLKSSPDTCPCGSGLAFSDCCDKFISHRELPTTAEQLMRSRYSAYVLKNESYLLETWHKSTRPEVINLENDTTAWKALHVFSCQDNKEYNTVHFVAFFTDGNTKNDRIFYLAENSAFIKEDRWYYLNGLELKTDVASKNMPCPCQSGKKFKRCCMQTM